MRPLLLPGLLDAARHNAAHGPPAARAVRVRARLPPVAAARARCPPGSPRRRARPAHERHHIGAVLTEARARHLAQPGARRGLLRRQGARSRRCSRASGCETLGRARRAAVPPPGPQRPRCWRATSASSAGSASCTRAVARAWDLDGAVAGVRARRRPDRRAGAGARAVPRRDHLPGGRPGHGGRGATRTCPPAASRQAMREGGGELLEPRRAVRRLSRRAGGRGPQVAGAAAGVPRRRTRTLTDEEVAALASHDRRRAGASIGGALRA